MYAVGAQFEVIRRKGQDVFGRGLDGGDDAPGGCIHSSNMRPLVLPCKTASGMQRMLFYDYTIISFVADSEMSG